MPLVKLFATAICASWLVVVATCFWLFVLPMLRLILPGVSGWEATSCIWIVCLTTTWCAVAAPYFFLGPPDTFSSFACGALCDLLVHTPQFWMRTTSVCTARGTRPASIWWVEGESILMFCVIWCCRLQWWTTSLWLTPWINHSFLSSRPSKHIYPRRYVWWRAWSLLQQSVYSGFESLTIRHRNVE